MPRLNFFRIQPVDSMETSSLMIVSRLVQSLETYSWIVGEVCDLANVGLRRRSRVARSHTSTSAPVALITGEIVR